MPILILFSKITMLLIIKNIIASIAKKPNINIKNIFSVVLAANSTNWFSVFKE